MRRGLAIGLAIGLAVHAQTVRGEPAPGVNPARLQREDAARIDDQQRRLDHDPAAPRGDDTVGPGAASEVDRTTAHRMRIASGVLFGVAAGSALTAGPLFAIWDERAADHRGSLGTWAAVFAASAVVTGAAGFTLFMASRHVRVAPAVSASELGFSIGIVGQL